MRKKFCYLLLAVPIICASTVLICHMQNLYNIEMVDKQAWLPVIHVRPPDIFLTEEQAQQIATGYINWKNKVMTESGIGSLCFGAVGWIEGTRLCILWKTATRGPSNIPTINNYSMKINLSSEFDGTYKVMSRRNLAVVTEYITFEDLQSLIHEAWNNLYQNN